jgi:CheY-like chemotaxis protein
MPSSEQKQMHRQHIFAVNGSPDFLDILRELLQEEQFNVTTINFVPGTFDQVSVLNPDLLIIDLAVGERAGWDLLEHLGTDAQTKGIPVIVVSTSPQILDDVQSKPDRFGGKWFLGKPIDLDDLLRAIDSLIGEA